MWTLIVVMGPKGTRIIVMIISLIDFVKESIRAVLVGQLYFKPFFHLPFL